MANFDTSALALAAVCPSNKMIMDDKGMPGVYVQVGAQNLSSLLTDGDDTVHPAFRVSGVEQPSLYIGKYQGIKDDNRIYSLPGVRPTNLISLNYYEKYCRNKGFGHHCITAAEWAFLALWCKKNGTQPKGNNSYGKDLTETVYQAIPVPGAQDDNGRTTCVLTGTGPLTWRHDGTIAGICDLNGNIGEWTAGMRLVHGELQVIPYNNAADPDVDTSADSAQWKAIKAAATSWENLFITPNGQGTTAGSIKIDWVSSHWQWAASITSQEDISRHAAFADTTFGTGVTDFCKMYLRAMALAPEDGDTDYKGDSIYADNGADERCAIRGGSWSYGTHTGVFELNFVNPRTWAANIFGGRPAYVELESE